MTPRDRPSVADLMAFLAAVPPAVVSQAQRSYNDIVNAISGIPARGDRPQDVVYPASLQGSVETLVHALVMTRPTEPVEPALVRVLLATVPAAPHLAYLARQSVVESTSRWGDPMPEGWVDPHGGRVWVPTPVAAWAALAPDIYHPIGEIRWVLDPALPIPMSQRAVLMSSLLVMPRRSLDPRPPLIADTLIALRNAAAPYGGPWCKGPLDRIRNIGSYDPFLAMCALLNRGVHPLDGPYELAAAMALPRDPYWPALLVRRLYGSRTTCPVAVLTALSAPCLEGSRDLGWIQTESDNRSRT